jgi:dipeptidyl aminopeptidase/acylaminoacyl peptidase
MRQPQAPLLQGDIPPTPLLQRIARERTVEKSKESLVEWPIDTFRGKIILFGTVHLDDLATPRIEAINPDGTGLETIVTLNKGEGIYGGRVSPDGSRLAFSLLHERGDDTLDAEVWLLGTDGVRGKLAEHGGDVRAWSPDGTRLACVRGKMHEWENVAFDVKTGHEHQLPIAKVDYLDDWAPDGQWLAVRAGNPDKQFEHPNLGSYPLRQIYLMKLDGSERQSLTTEPMLDDIAARFSPDGQSLVYHDRRHQDGRVLHFSVVQGRDGGEARAILNFNEFFQGNAVYRSHGDPCWSPDGTSAIWIVPRRKTRSSDMRVELVLISVASGDATRLNLYQNGIAWVQGIDWR